MSDATLELARQGYEAWNRSDLDWFLEHLAEEAEVRPIRGFNDFDDVYVGHEGWKQFWEVWHDAWERIEIRVERMEDMGEHGVLALLTFDAVGRTSGVETSMPVSHWLSFRDGLLAGIIAMAPETAERRRADRG